ncbi:alpha/beta hydrolase [Paracoccus yeei]|uniref:Esterase n=1 Tax=Paracoccus yeei TaxID=147645 RepID=A0A2D2C5J9_9RHOB|nr:alpha/beta hydrolase [Paracoccus yeei]ATQ57790.1 esterase [Paracoccus yeei]
MPVRLAILLVLLSGMLSACSPRPTGLMQPVVAPVETGPAVDVLVATNRQMLTDRAERYGGRRDPQLHLDAVKVGIPANRPSGTIQWPRARPPQPTTDFHVRQVQDISSVAQGRAWMRQHRVGGHVLLFVHGFNTTYGEAVYRLAQIAHDGDVAATPILFTWPSRGSPVGYNYDRESALYSRTALEQSLRILADDPSVTQITILAHSMGAFLTMESLRQMSIRSGPVNPKIRDVVLASPDIDIEVFSRQFIEMAAPRPRFTIFMAKDDRALGLSRLIAGRVERVGEIDPSREPYRTALLQAGIDAIDLSQIDVPGGTHHSRFAESPDIVRLIGRKLAQGQRLTSDNGSGGSIFMVAAGTLHTLGAVVTAPARVLEEGAEPQPSPGTTLAADPSLIPAGQ